MTLPLALTMGDPAGIGAEIAGKAWARRSQAGLAPFAVVADPALFRDTPIAPIERWADAVAAFESALPVLSLTLSTPAHPGRPDPANAAATIASIERALAAVQAGEAAAIVTNPIAKHVLAASGFPHPGHTEFLAALAGVSTAPIMMLAVDGLRVVPVTIHMPLAEVPRRLTEDAIVHAGRVTAAALVRDFGIARPRLAVAGLNPHAGESGMLGGEDAAIVAPAIARLRAEGIDATGPHPADTLFHAAARARYDAALAMYHDQALIPVKTLDFERGVNVTLGLPFVRTSPDHGTAFDIAGQGVASPESLIAALQLARRMADARGPIAVPLPRPGGEAR